MVHILDFLLLQEIIKHWVTFQADDDLSIFNNPIYAIYVEKHVGSIFVKNVGTKKTWQMTSRIFLIDVLIQTPSLGVMADVERFHIFCQQGIASRLRNALKYHIMEHKQLLL